MMTPLCFNRDIMKELCSDASSHAASCVARKDWRRATVLGMILLFSLLWTQISSADNTLLRGPRKTVHSNVEGTGPLDAKQGLLQRFAAAPVLFYQRFLGPQWGWRCAYHPSCSDYSRLSIQKHGALIGWVMTFDRLQHEADEAGYSPLIVTGGQIKAHDPLVNNDFWWHLTTGSAMKESIVSVGIKKMGIQEEENDR